MKFTTLATLSVNMFHFLINNLLSAERCSTATAVLAREKSTSLAELFSVELKFAIDNLNNWFSSTIKPKFLELHDNRKHLFIKENPLIPSETTCVICGFLLDGEAKGDGKLRWYDFIVDCEHLFLRNVY